MQKLFQKKRHEIDLVCKIFRQHNLHLFVCCVVPEWGGEWVYRNDF